MTFSVSVTHGQSQVGPDVVLRSGNNRPLGSDTEEGVCVSSTGGGPQDLSDQTQRHSSCWSFYRRPLFLCP